MTYTGWKTLEIILLVAAAVLFIAAAIVWRVLRVRQAHQALNGQDREREIEILRSSRVGTWLDPVEDELHAETGAALRPAERATREQPADEAQQPTKRTRTQKSAAGNRDRNAGAPTSLGSDAEAEIDDSSETELVRTSLAKKRRKRAASNDDEIDDPAPTTLVGHDEEDDSTPTVLAKRGSKRSAAKKANDASDDDDAPTVLAGIRKHGVRQTVDADDDEDSAPTILWHSDAEDANVPQGAADNTDDSEDEAPTVLADGRKKKGGRR